MFVFKSKLKNTYIATNPKVLTRTLYDQKELSRYVSKKRYFHFLLNKFSIGPNYIFLSRDPYSRIESFFKEKLRQKVKMVLDKDNPYQLKRHQEIFYPFFNIDSSYPDSLKVEKLLNIDFNEFIRIIPRVYKIEDHLNLQTDNFSRKFLNLNLGPNFSTIVHIEDKEAMSSLASELKLDLSRRNNSSEDVDDILIWNKRSIEIVNDLYQKDFEILGYKTRK